MFGPVPRKNLTSAGCKRVFQNLVAGQRYKVVSEFVDFDGDVHRQGEVWTFLGANFLPYEDGQSLFVSFDGKNEWHIRLQWRAEEQANILDHFEHYVQPET